MSNQELFSLHYEVENYIREMFDDPNSNLSHFVNYMEIMVTTYVNHDSIYTLTSLKDTPNYCRPRERGFFLRGSITISNIRDFVVLNELRRFFVRLT